MSFHPSLLTPHAKAKKMMLWFGMISMTMMFAGLTSAYVVSKSRPDWLENFVLPVSFYVSTAVIVLSSITFWLAFKNLKDKKNFVLIYLTVTLILAIIFSSICSENDNCNNKCSSNVLSQTFKNAFLFNLVEFNLTCIIAVIIFSPFFNPL